MEIRTSQVRDLFKSRYPWAEEIEVKDHTNWVGTKDYTLSVEGPHWEVDVNDEGVWRKFMLQIKVTEV